MQIARADDLESLFKAARSKFKAMKKAPNTARLHAPPGPAIEDSRSLAPNAVVFVDFDETKDAAKKHARRKPRAAVFANALAAVNKREDDASAETVAEISAGDTPRVDANDMATDADTAGAEPEFLGFLDADTFFSAAVHPGELFEYDASTRAWRPRVIAYNIKTPWGLRTPFALGGQPKVLEAMVRARAKGERARASPLNI